MIDDIEKQLRHFFPGQSFTTSGIETGLQKGEILTAKDQILPFLQTALFDDKVLEVELDGVDRVYFSRLKDDYSDFIADETDSAATDEYNQGDYLTVLNHIVILPLEPGLGSLHLRQSRFVILRMFTRDFAVETVTTFETMTKVDDLPVLRLSFPSLAIRTHNGRQFRAKVPESLDFVVGIKPGEKLPELETQAIDISLNGMAFSVRKTEQKMFIPGAKHSLKLYINDELLVLLTGTVKHLSRVRKRAGIEYICGMEFNLTTQTLAAVIESIVASVQRAHLKDLAAKSDTCGINLIA